MKSAGKGKYNFFLVYKVSEQRVKGHIISSKY